MQELLWKRSEPEETTTTANAASAPSPQQPPVTMTNYRCKQKQYHNVLWSLQFLLAFLRHRPQADIKAATSVEHIPASSGVSDAPRVSSRGASENDTEARALQQAVQNFLSAAEGVDASFDSEGPLSASQLLSLQHSFSDDQVRALCVECLRVYVQQRQQQLQREAFIAPPRPLSQATVFAVPTELMRTLWPTEGFCAHYTAALTEAHRHRIDHSHLLGLPGYLQEAGLHAERVFTGKADLDDSSTFTDPRELRAAEEWRRLIRSYTAFLPDRSHIHELENLPQEVAIGELLCEAAAAAAAPAEGGTGGGAALDCVVDVGGGNGFLAAQAAERLQCDGVIIDPFFPAHAIDCCPRLWPDTPHRTHAATRRRYTLHRTMALFRDVRWADVVPAVPARTALIAKHLCGSGVDEVLRHLEAQGCLPRILVLAPCCFNKISFDTYCNPAYLQQTMGIASEAGLARVHRLTDWNMSCYQSTHEALLTHGGRKRQRCSKDATPTCDDCDLAKASEANASQAFSYERRSGPRSIVNSITCTHAFARLVEGLLNYGRMSWLRSRGYKVQLVQYVPDVVTPKNMCLVAIRRSQLSEE